MQVSGNNDLETKENVLGTVPDVFLFACIVFLFGSLE
jgi:hypothetical protein